MLGESLREKPITGVLLPAHVAGWKKQLRIDRDKSCCLLASTASVWQEIALNCMKQPDPLQAFEAEVQYRHPEAIIAKADDNWRIMPFGEWMGMPKIHLELQDLPLYESDGHTVTVFSNVNYAG